MLGINNAAIHAAVMEDKMARYRLMASYGFAGDETEVGKGEYDSEEDAAKEAYEAACERVDAWAELVEDEQ